MFKIKLIPQDKKFFELFSKIAKILVEISENFVLFLENFNSKEFYLIKINELQNDGINTADELTKKLLSTFVTPIDREDTHALAKLFSGIINHIHSVTVYFNLYSIDTTTDRVVELSKILLSCSKELSFLISKLYNMSELSKISYHIDEIHKFENRGDEIFRKAIRELFSNNYDALYVLKWKDIYNRIENAIDKCNDSANVILGIILKYA